MRLNYKPKKLGKTVADLSAIKKNYGTMAKDVNIRINELKHATTLEDMSFLPKANKKKKGTQSHTEVTQSYTEF